MFCQSKVFLYLIVHSLTLKLRTIMKNISIWASKNSKKAIGLIILIELLKAIFGIIIGNELLPVLSIPMIELVVLLIVFFVSYWQINDEYQVLELNKNNRYSFRVFKTATVFLCTFLLSILVGNYFKRVDYRIDSQWNSYAGVTTKKDSVNVAESLSFFEKVIQQKHNFETNTQKLSKTQTNDTGKRVGYVLLFMLSLILTYFGAVLSCSLACSSYGFFAILAFLLTLGILSGGFYFLIKSFRKTIKTSKEMTHEEKKKERKKFFTIWGVVTAIIALLIVIANA